MCPRYEGKPRHPFRREERHLRRPPRMPGQPGPGVPNFTVARSSARSTGIEPVACPFILRGCSWGTCSPRSGLPRRVSALGRPAVTWTTSLHADGRRNAAFDVWFGKHAMTTGQANGAELMIWLRARGITVPARTPVTRRQVPPADPLHHSRRGARMGQTAVVGREHRSRVRTVARRHRARHGLVLGEGIGAAAVLPSTGVPAALRG
jgi:hypothetical protein